MSSRFMRPDLSLIVTLLKSRADLIFCLLLHEIDKTFRHYLYHCSPIFDIIFFAFFRSEMIFSRCLFRMANGPTKNITLAKFSSNFKGLAVSCF